MFFFKFTIFFFKFEIALCSQSMKNQALGKHCLLCYSFGFSFLRQLIHVNCKVIMTAGNHDSPAVLNGPKDILAMLNIDIAANVPSGIDEGIIELKNKNGETECVVCAVPYLRDGDIRTAMESETYKNRVEQKFLGMKTYF